MKVPINKDSPLAMDDFDAAVQQRMERLQSYIDLIRTAEAVEEEVKAKNIEGAKAITILKELIAKNAQ